MGTILSFIGFVVVVKFCVKHRRAFMDKQAFYQSVKKLREAITKGWVNSSKHFYLDEIVHNVLGEETMENLDDNLTQHIVQHIKQLKAAKEQEKLEAKAKGILDSIKAALDE